MGNYFAELQAIKLGIKQPAGKKEPQPIAKVSEKKKQQLKEEKPTRDLQLQWYHDKVNAMTGICMECGCRINKKDFEFAIMTVAHVLPKRKDQFPSVATHEENSLELCVTNGCHGRYDNSWEDAAQMKVWPLAVKKFLIIYPAIAAKERKHIPDVLMQELEPSVLIAAQDTELNTTIIEKG
jgi:hypothetical protein